MTSDTLQSLDLIYTKAKAQAWAEDYINIQFDNAESSYEIKPGFRATLHAVKLVEAKAYLAATSPVDAEYPILGAGVGVLNGSTTFAEEAAKVVARDDMRSARLAILEKRRLSLLARMRGKQNVAEIKGYLASVNFPAVRR